MPAFASPDFRRLFFNDFFTAASRWALMLARGWLVFELTNSSFAVGIVTFAAMAQFIFVSPVAGALADRLDRRRQAMVGVALLALSAATLAALTLGGGVEVWHVVVLAAVDGIAVSGSQPALQALIPSVVPREQLLNAVSLSGVTRHGSRFAGPLLGGILLETLGAGFVFLFAAIGLTFALRQLTRLRYRPTERAAEATAEGSAARVAVRVIARDVRDGFAYAFADRRLVVILGCVAIHCGFTMAFDSMMPRLATDLGGGSSTYSAIVMGVGAGAITGTLAISMVRGHALQGRALALTGAGSGLAMLVLGLVETPALAVLGAALAGGTQATYMAISLTLVLTIVPDSMRGRVTAIYMMLAAGHMAMMNFGFGWLADVIGVRPLLIVPGIAWLVFFGIAALSLSELRHVLRHGEFRPRTAMAGAGVVGD